MGGRTSLFVGLLYLFNRFCCSTGTCLSEWNGTGPALYAGCYKISLEQKSYVEHELSCRQEGGHLASIHSVTEQNTITSLLQYFTGRLFFIGLTDVSIEGDWKYSDSTPFDFSNWEKGEPNNLGDEDCVQVKTNGLWNDVPCSKRYGAVCKREESVTTVKNEQLTVNVTKKFYENTVTLLENEIVTPDETKENDGKTVTPAENEVSTHYETEEYSEQAVTNVGRKFLAKNVTSVDNKKATTPTESEIVPEYVTKEYRYREKAVSTAKNEFLTEYVTTEYEEKPLSTVKNEFLTEYVTTEYEERELSTAKNEFLTEYVTTEYEEKAISTAENEFLTKYVTTEYEEKAVATAENEVPTEYVTKEHGEGAVTTVENKFLTEYLTTEYGATEENCPGEWFQFDNFCYFVDTTKRMFRDAKRACRTRGGELASIHSEEEQSFVYSILREDVQSYFIGLTLDTQTGTWNYTDNSSVDFTNWYPNMPDGRGFERCVEVYFYIDGKWNDVSCFSPFNGAVCKSSLGSSLISGPLIDPEPNMIECGNGWLNYYDESLYCSIEKSLQWNEAAEKCSEYSGHLVSIQDKYENDFLLEAMKNFDVEFVWIGMSDLHEEGVWRWENSHDIPSYTGWDYLEPNNVYNEDCAVMHFRWGFRPRRGSWYDMACCHEFPSICEKQL